MPIIPPALDDRRFDDLVSELVALIPRHAPKWTDHNASDPGITLIELFSWLAEALLYRQNRIPRTSEAGFLQLLGGGGSGEDLGAGEAESEVLQSRREAWRAAAIERLDEVGRETVLGLRKRWRAVTAEDFEAIVVEQAGQGIARARCLPGLDLASEPPVERLGYVSVVIVPEWGAAPGLGPKPSEAQLRGVAAVLEERRLLTCRVHVAGPSYTEVRVDAELNGLLSAPVDLGRRVERALSEFLDPLTGGPDGDGWPFGRDVHASEVCQVIEAVEGVDFVERVTLTARSEGEDDWLDWGDRVAIPPNHLVAYAAASSRVHLRGAGAREEGA